jgi:outer membrane protein TolC
LSHARKLRSIAACGVALLTAGGPRAQPFEDDPILAALVEEALAQNPDIARALEDEVAARSRPAQASSLADPMLSVVYTNDGWSPSLGSEEDSNLALMGSQDLPYPGKRRLREELAGFEAEGAVQQLARAQLSITADVKRAYYGLLQTRDLLNLAREQEETWKQIEGVTRTRYAVGEGAQQDVLRVQVEVTRIGQLLTEQQAERQIRLAEINRLLARPAETPLETTAPLALDPSRAPLAELLERLRGISPELASARLAVLRSQRAVDLAHKEFRPDFTVQGAYMERAGLDPMWQAGVGMSLPIYRQRLKSALAEAEARLRSDERRVASVELRLRARTQERLAELDALVRIADLYGNGIIPQGQMSFEAAVANYRTGKVPFIAVLETLTTLYGDRATYLRLLASHERTRASLEEASLEPRSDGMGAAAMAASGTVSGGMNGAAMGRD